MPLNLEKLPNMTVYTLSSTNIDQSAPNSVKMDVIIRSQMSTIMDLIESEPFELSALELENLLYLTVYTLASADIVEQIKPEHLELFALEFGKIAETDFVYTLASPNIKQSAPDLVKMYVTIRSRMSFDYGFNWSRTV